MTDFILVEILQKIKRVKRNFEKITKKYLDKRIN